MLKKLSAFLNQPYPDSDDIRSIILGGLLAGFIVFLILVLLVPFGLGELSRSKWILYNLCFGLITVVVVVCYELTQKHVLKFKKDVASWTLWKWIVSVAIMILLIAIANYLFISFIFEEQQSLPGFIDSLYSTCIIAIFPTLFIGSINVIRNLKANQNLASSINLSEVVTGIETEVLIPIKDSEKTVKIKASDILYAEAMQNYVLIYLLQGQDVEKVTIRNTFSNVAVALNETSVIRSHRSFMINVDKIDSISGNAQGLKIKLKDLPETVIPVSRNYIPAFKAL